MDTELQKQLLEILRELRAGATPAWQELVAQRSAYAGMQALMCFVVGLLGIVAFVLLLRWAKRSSSDFINVPETALPFAFAVGVTGVCGTVLPILGIWKLATWVAPLGSILGNI